MRGIVSAVVNRSMRVKARRLKVEQTPAEIKEMLGEKPIAPEPLPAPEPLQVKVKARGRLVPVPPVRDVPIEELRPTDLPAEIERLKRKLTYNRAYQSVLVDSLAGHKEEEAELAKKLGLCEAALAQVGKAG
jgi:hypothetical protein